MVNSTSLPYSFSAFAFSFVMKQRDAALSHMTFIQLFFVLILWTWNIQALFSICWHAFIVPETPLGVTLLVTALSSCNV